MRDRPPPQPPVYVIVCPECGFWELVDEQTFRSHVECPRCRGLGRSPSRSQP